MGPAKRLLKKWNLGLSRGNLLQWGTILNIPDSSVYLVIRNLASGALDMISEATWVPFITTNDK